jgi:hypothetical protein
MAASRSEGGAVCGAEPFGPGTLIERCGAGARSYDHRGAAFTWVPPAGCAARRWAVDVEAKDHPTASGMVARFGLRPEEFLRRWTASEALAKVLDRPILDLVRREGLVCEPGGGVWREHRPGVWLRALDHPTHWVAVAVML